jgi:hypothetical protein
LFARGVRGGHRQHRATEFRRFLVAIDKAIPLDLDVHLVCDNLATHKTPTIHDWLPRHPRFHLHFTPTGSSWINEVERWFEAAHRPTHPPRSPQERRRPGERRPAMDQELEPRPETIHLDKECGGILQSLSKYIAKISGAGY